MKQVRIFDDLIYASLHKLLQDTCGEVLQIESHG